MNKVGGLLFLLTACACAHAGPSKRKVERCTPLLEEILIIQDLREELNQKIEVAIHDRKANELTKEQYHEIFELWISRENNLRSYVTELYDRAYKTKCL